MDIEEQIYVISTGSKLRTLIEPLLDLIDNEDMSVFVNAEVEVKSFLRSSLEDASSKLAKDIYEAKEQLRKGVKP